MKVSLLCALTVVTAVGCKKNEGSTSSDPAQDLASEKPREAGTKAPKPPTAASGMPEAFNAWDIPTRLGAWQGAWAGDGGAVGHKAAWLVEDKKLRYVTKEGEKQLAFKLESPCTAKFVETNPLDGTTIATTAVYTLQNGQVVTGLGDAGSRKGENAIVCGSGKIFTLDAKGCLEWENNFGDKLTSAAGTCGFRRQDGKDMFFYKAHGRETTLIVDGDVIWSEQLRGRHATKHPDLAAAKKAQGL